MCFVEWNIDYANPLSWLRCGFSFVSIVCTGFRDLSRLFSVIKLWMIALAPELSNRRTGNDYLGSYLVRLGLMLIPVKGHRYLFFLFFLRIVIGVYSIRSVMLVTYWLSEKVTLVFRLWCYHPFIFGKNCHLLLGFIWFIITITT